MAGTTGSEIEPNFRANLYLQGQGMKIHRLEQIRTPREMSEGSILSFAYEGKVHACPLVRGTWGPVEEAQSLATICIGREVRTGSVSYSPVEEAVLLPRDWYVAEVTSKGPVEFADGGWRYGGPGFRIWGGQGRGLEGEILVHDGIYLLRPGELAERMAQDLER